MEISVTIVLALGVGICAAGGLFAVRIGSRQKDED